MRGRPTKEEDTKPYLFDHARDLTDRILCLARDKNDTLGARVGVCSIHDGGEDAEESASGTGNTSILHPSTL